MKLGENTPKREKVLSLTRVGILNKIRSISSREPQTEADMWFKDSYEPLKKCFPAQIPPRDVIAGWGTRMKTRDQKTHLRAAAVAAAKACQTHLAEGNEEQTTFSAACEAAVTCINNKLPNTKFAKEYESWNRKMRLPPEVTAPLLVAQLLPLAFSSVPRRFLAWCPLLPVADGL